MVILLFFSSFQHNSKTKGMDINITEIWYHNISGEGVVVAVIDDGKEVTLTIILSVNVKGFLLDVIFSKGTLTHLSM